MPTEAFTMESEPIAFAIKLAMAIVGRLAMVVIRVAAMAVSRPSYLDKHFGYSIEPH